MHILTGLRYLLVLTTLGTLMLLLTLASVVPSDEWRVQMRDLPYHRYCRDLHNSLNVRLMPSRWLRDHFFVSKQFQLMALKYLPDEDSARFPLYIELALPDKQIIC